MAEISGSTSDFDIVAVYTTPLEGLTVSLDRSTLEAKTIEHGVAWVSLEQCQLLFEDPELIYESQHEWAKGKLLFYRRPFITTPYVKYVRGVADFRFGAVGRIISVHPKRGIGNTGPQVYPTASTETTDVEK
jgi:hypothetical protein